MSKIFTLAIWAVMTANTWGVGKNFTVPQSQESQNNIYQTEIDTIKNVAKFGFPENIQKFFKTILDLLKSKNGSEQRNQKKEEINLNRLSAINSVRIFESIQLFLKVLTYEEADIYVDVDKLHFVDINSQNDYHWTSLFYACKNGRGKLTKYFLNLGSDVNKKDDIGRTPLFYARENGNIKIVIACLEKGANVNEEDKLGSTPLFAACYFGHKPIVEYLVNQGANVNKIKKEESKTALNSAYNNGYIDIVKYLVENGSDPSFILNSASKKGDKDMVKYLVENGANVDFIDYNGQTPLYVAQNNSILNYLFKHGARLIEDYKLGQTMAWKKFEEEQKTRE